MAKERLPFKLARPNSNIGVTDASEIDWGDEPLDKRIEGKDTKVDKNSSNIEEKVNALVGIVQDLVLNVAFHSGIPFGIPQSILSKLSLLRIGDGSSSGDLPAICGHDTICGRVTCGIE